MVATYSELVQTYLQMLSPGDLLPASAPALPLEVQELTPDSPLIRSTTLGIGRDHQWPSLAWDDAQWRDYLRRPYLRHWAARVQGVNAGLVSLDVPPGGDVELDTFGLLPDYVGQGVGGHFLTVGTRLAWAVAPDVERVWLHTSSLDHPNALPNYEHRGFRRYQPKQG
jgi:GNAT superfamily N-acetyltransferase